MQLGRGQVLISRLSLGPEGHGLEGPLNCAGANLTLLREEVGWGGGEWERKRGGAGDLCVPAERHRKG
jgi:hypothetical protein